MFTGPELPYITTGRPRLAVFLRVATPTPIRVWTGAGAFGVPADAVEVAPAVYRGIGDLQGVPVLGQLLNGAAEKVTFTLAGLPADLADLADADAADLRFAVVRVGLMALDEHWQPASTMKWIWQGSCDGPRGARSLSPVDGSPIRSIAIEVGTAHTSRARPRQAVYTDPDQKRRSPTDRFCDRVVRYTAGATRKWPNYA